MITIALDENNNIINASSWQTKSNLEALKQDIKNRLSLFNKEYPFDITKGIDYINLLSMNRQSDLKNAILQEILKDSRVKSAKIKQINHYNNQLVLNFEITSINNEVFNV